nr:hypothetical protein [Bacteroidota bacterium]
MKAILFLCNSILFLLLQNAKAQKNEKFSCEKPKYPTAMHSEADSLYPFEDRINGGYKQFKTFIDSNIVIPQEIYFGVKGTVILELFVDSDCVITKVKVTQGIQDCKECEKEAIRLVKAYKHFLPGYFYDREAKQFFPESFLVFIEYPPYDIKLK